MSGVRISSVALDSPAGLSGVLVGEHLIAVNGREPSDIIEYQQLIDGDTVDLELADGERRRHVVIKKPVGERLGITVDSAVFDRIRTCDNHCSFCFIYQLPKGLRRSLYVKDDDFRLSFLYGNYTTLTRFTEFDLERVIDERLSPLYVSIHTTDPELRASMLRNERGATSLRWLRVLLDAGVDVHGQVVVCPGVNDGAALERTLEDVLSQFSALRSIAVVPLGVSDFSTEATMRPHTASEAGAVIDLVDEFQVLAAALLSRRMIYASDEFYLVANRPCPSAHRYDSLDEAENGVGLVAAFSASFTNRHAMASLGTGFFQSVDGAPAWGYRADRSSAETSGDSQRLTVLTGEYAEPILRDLLAHVGRSDVEVAAVRNQFFGGNIKVAGLLAGADIARHLEQIDGSRTVLLPDVCLSEGRFIDGLSLDDLPRHVEVVPTTGVALRERLDGSVSEHRS